MDTEQEHGTVYSSPVKSIFDKFAQNKDVTLVYGETIDLTNKRVLPVAKVSYSFGGGGGYSEASDHSPAGQGEGGGGHIAIKPLGVYEITTEKVKFKPIIEFRMVALVFALCTVVTMCLLKNKEKSSNE
ncbi:spore germination protein GerW family protein [Sporosarcina beigongshangi]|uniref:spore germination protein GerW family protein n=1 Tax=Sporosarcina beigongshangi TaxID=2782538 RepID=UPI001939FE83|nr:spore germination protein GerW family protein [Sporosarcina beigongshangi]